MRGVVALAAVSLPRVLENEQPFAQRGTIIFLTFSVIFVTLVVQGLTLPALIRKLGVSETDGPNCEEEEARGIVLQAALNHLEEIRKADGAEFASVYDDLARRYRLRLFLATGRSDNTDGADEEHIQRFRKASNEMRKSSARRRSGCGTSCASTMKCCVASSMSWIWWIHG